MVSIPTSANRRMQRSSIHELIEGMHPRWTDVHGMPVAVSFASVSIEQEALGKLAINDTSCFPKLTVRGKGCVSFLERQGVTVPQDLFGWSRLNEGALVIRTDREEVFLENGLVHSFVASMIDLVERTSPKLFWVESQDASFLLSGSESYNVLLETCGFDFKSSDDHVVFTRVAGVSCKVLLFKDDPPLFRFWVDRSYGSYLWKALLTIVEDKGGRAVGLACVYPEILSTLKARLM